MLPFHSPFFPLILRFHHSVNRSAHPPSSLPITRRKCTLSCKIRRALESDTRRSLAEAPSFANRQLACPAPRLEQSRYRRYCVARSTGSRERILAGRIIWPTVVVERDSARLDFASPALARYEEELVRRDGANGRLLDWIVCEGVGEAAGIGDGGVGKSRRHQDWECRGSRL